MAALEFALDPSKQSFHQKTAADWIRAIPGVENFDSSPVKGATTYCIVHGPPVRGSELHNAKNTKSVDFYWDALGRDRRRLTDG